MTIKDVQLIPSENNKYDWNFGIDDVAVVTNNEGLKNSVIQQIRLIPYELETELGATLGNKAYEYIKAKPTEHVKLLIKEHILSNCKSIYGVDNATIELNLKGYEITTSIILLKNNGEEVVINDITL